MKLSTRRARTLPLAAALLTATLASSAAVVDAAPTPGGSFATTGSMNQSREGGGTGFGTMATVLPDGRAIVAGGFSLVGTTFNFASANYLSAAEIYDPRTGTWSTTASMHQPRFAAALVTLSTGKVLAAGGYSGYGAATPRTAELYDPGTGMWDYTAEMPDCKASPSVSVLTSGKVFLAGGFGCHGVAQRSTFLYDPAAGTWTQMASMHTARWGHSGTVLADGRVLVAGGRRSAAGRPQEQVNNSAEIYDPGSDTWTTVAPMADPRAFHAAGLLDGGKVIVAGGHCPGGDTSPVMGCTTAATELYDPATGMWSPGPAMSGPRVEGAANVLPASSSLTHGGFVMAGGGMLKTAEVYDTDANTWRTPVMMDEFHDDAQMLMLGTGKLLVLGGFKETAAGYVNVDAAELFTPPGA